MPRHFSVCLYVHSFNHYSIVPYFLASFPQPWEPPRTATTATVATIATVTAVSAANTHPFPTSGPSPSCWRGSTVWARALGAQHRSTPPPLMAGSRPWFVRQGGEMRKAFYMVGNFVAGAEMQQLVQEGQSVVLDRYLHHSTITFSTNFTATTTTSTCTTFHTPTSPVTTPIPTPTYTDTTPLLSRTSLAKRTGPYLRGERRGSWPGPRNFTGPLLCSYWPCPSRCVDPMCV
jgi:hypothetical protein